MKRKIFLFAVLLPCIAFALTAAFAFKPVSGKPVTSVKQVYEDSDWYYDPLEAELDDLAYDTWVADGSPGGDDIKANSSGTFNHYCCASSPAFSSQKDRLDWVWYMMGGRSNSNHVHYIQWDYFSGPWGVERWSAKVKYWTSAPCWEFCNW